MVKFGTVMLVLGVVAFVCQPAGAVLIRHSVDGQLVDETWESYNAGETPVGTFEAMGSSVGSWQVLDQNSPGPGAYQGDKYLQVTGGAGGQFIGGSWFDGDHIAYDAGTLHFEWMMYVHSDFGSGGRRYINTAGTGVAAGATYWLDFGDGSSAPWPSIYYEWYDGGWHFDDTGLDIVPDTWQHWEVDLNVDGAPGDWWAVLTLDGTATGPLETEASFFEGSMGQTSVAFFDLVNAVGGSSADTVLYFDAIPEPATIGLLALGALGLLRRRKA